MKKTFGIAKCALCRNQNILWLQVSVENFVPVAMIDPRNNLSQNDGDLRLAVWLRPSLYSSDENVEELTFVIEQG